MSTPSSRESLLHDALQRLVLGLNNAHYPSSSRCVCIICNEESFLPGDGHWDSSTMLKHRPSCPQLIAAALLKELGRTA